MEEKGKYKKKLKKGKKTNPEAAERLPQPGNSSQRHRIRKERRINYKKGKKVTTKSKEKQRVENPFQESM